MKKLKALSGIVFLLFASACSQPKSTYTTSRDYQIVGEDIKGNQYLAAVTVTYSGLFGSQFLLDGAVDNQHVGANVNQTYPTLVSVLQKRARQINVTVAESSPEEAKNAIQSELEEGLEQFNGQRVLFKADSVEVGRYTDFYTTCLSNMQRFLDAQPEGFYGEKPNCSATDSDGDRNITATVIDLKASKKFERAIQAVFQVPVTASGGPKLDTVATQAQYPELEGLGNALQGASGVNPLIMPNVGQ